MVKNFLDIFHLRCVRYNVDWYTLCGRRFGYIVKEQYTYILYGATRCRTVEQYESKVLFFAIRCRLSAEYWTNAVKTKKSSKMA